jgi:phospholipase C
MGAHCEAYYAAPTQVGYGLPNVLWLEAGQDFGITTDQTPGNAHFGATDHLVNQLEAAGISWKAYVEGATAGQCPVADNPPRYRTWHVPFLYFDDVAGNPPAPGTQRCVEHVAPMSQLAQDLQGATVPRYAFLVPDMCDDMHDNCNTGDPVRQGDDWLAATMPAILASPSYANGGAVFIAWDFSQTGYVPIGFIALSPNARPGFASQTTLGPSDTLRTLETIFGVGPPWIQMASNAQTMAELFSTFP